MNAPVAAPRHAGQHASLYSLGLIALMAILFGLGLAYAIDAASRSARVAPHRTDAVTTLTRSVGGREVTIPLSWFRNPEGATQTISKQVELTLALPLGPDGAAREIDVALVPRSTVRASALLLDGVYLHMFETDEIAGPPGLVGKPLRAIEGYQAETVWFDAISADPFVAKCSAPVRDGDPSTCLRVVYLAPALAAVYRFDADVLQSWRAFDAQLDTLMRRIGAREG